MTSLGKVLSEKEIAEVLLTRLAELGYKAVTELVVDNTYLDVQELTNKPISKVRIDVAAIKDKKITFIEVENGLWVTHPLQYLGFAHQVLLAYPAEATAPTDSEQIFMAQKKGIGIVSVSSKGRVTSVLRPESKKIEPLIATTVSSLLEKRWNLINK